MLYYILRVVIQLTVQIKEQWLLFLKAVHYVVDEHNYSRDLFQAELVMAIIGFK